MKIWLMTEEVDVTVWAQATDHRGAWRSVDGQALRADGNFSLEWDFKLGRPAASIRQEKRAAREAIARDGGK
jgi:hypothetical protein